MKEMNVSEVRKNLPKLVGEVASTLEPVLIVRHGHPLAMLVPCSEDSLRKMSDRFPLRGLPLEMAPDFDDPLDAEWEALNR